ncbi:DEAD/DEAH box helicase [Nitrosomonas sp. Nm33]|uniref:DEAD/DEAH box helicase n=1 Tax=Nitrosomonas sp. Nm33 TaxID=133724 RepID=UPI00210EEF30|nr:3'-5' exonuclease [Nitrosomonas sp. Nm33]
MTTLIPSYSTCISRMTAGERRFAQRLEAKLEDDYLCWYDVPIGQSMRHPDFIVLHPKRGLLILEVKDWKLTSIQSITKTDVTLLMAEGLVHKRNPLEQARQYAHAVANMLQKDAQLVFSSGRMQGQLLFPWSYGVVLANISRKQFDSTDLAEVLEPRRIICQDEMVESVEMEVFQKHLWDMFTLGGYGNLSLPQIDRIRWHMFPEIRIPAKQGDLFDKTETTAAELPSILQIMDLQQEQLARSLGAGHRIIHGVAGSGKTLILGYRAKYLSQICSKPILILCYNKVLAKRLEYWIQQKEIAGKVNVLTFHAWCHRQLTAYNIGLPAGDIKRDGYWDDMVNQIIRAVDNKLIPSGQYEAVLIDEGHDFRPEWLKLIVQMVDPRTNSLLILYDDAQSIYHAAEKRNFSFKSIGIQAQGRTTILKINYRNTQEILQFAGQFAGQLLTPTEADEDSAPRLMPISAGRKGPEPLLIKLPSLQEQVRYITEQLKAAHKDGMPWKDMAILYRHWDPVGKIIRDALTTRGIPFSWKKDIEFSGKQDTIKLLTFHSSKGLEFPLVAIPAANMQADARKNSEEEVCLFYVAMTRATRELIVLESIN